MHQHYDSSKVKQTAFVVGIGCLLLLLSACNEELPPLPTPTLPPTTQPTLSLTGDFDIVSSQTLYVPAYSQVYHYNKQLLNLAVTLSVHNTDPNSPILITTVDYYNSDGIRVASLLTEPQTLGALATADFFVNEMDVGGVGANFIVNWVADRQVYEPVVEAIMISTSGTQGISLISPGRVISQTR